MSRDIRRLLMALLSLAASDALGWTGLDSRDGGFPEPNVVYHRMAMDLAQLSPGMKVHLAVACPKARYFSVSVYDQRSGSSLAFATDREITGATDLARPACVPGREVGLTLVPAASGGGRRELVVPALAGREGILEIWFRAYLGEDVEPPEVSLIAPDGREAGRPVGAPVHVFSKGMRLLEAARQAKRLPPESEGDKMIIAPTDGSGWFPNGHPYLFARLDATNPLVRRRFKRLPLLGGERFAVVRFKSPRARYWSVCMYDAPSSTLLRDKDGAGACVNDSGAKTAADGTVTVVLASPEAAARARAMGADALPVYYPRRVVAMPLMLFRIIPNGPASRDELPALEGRFYPVESLESVVKGGP